MIPERPPPGESQANGVIEEAGKTTREYARVLKVQLEDHAQIQLSPADPIMPWIVRWAAMLISRYALGKDGLTPYERRRGRRCRLPLAKFGEHVYDKPLGKPRGGNMEVRSQSRVWLGHTRNSSEHLVGTAEGVVRAHSINRRDPDSQWCAEAIRTLRGSPKA